MTPSQITAGRITAGQISDARRRIKDFVYHTPLERTARLGNDVYLKLECWQRTRSFKVRGAFNAIAKLEPGGKLVTASAGNHGQAVALAARELGAHATVFVPANAPQTKKARIAALGATLDESGAHYDESEILAREFAERTGATFIHAYSDPDVVAGQGTVALEILDDLPGLRTIVVPVGGGGLIAGVGIALKDRDPSIRVLGVQSEKTAAMYDAFRAGRVVDSPLVPTLADGLAGAVDEISYARAREVVDEMLVVSEDALARAIRDLYNRDGIVAEGSGAVGVAAVAERIIPQDGVTAVIVSGGNIDAQRLAAIILSA